jgi:hypothetical protein
MCDFQIGHLSLRRELSAEHVACGMILQLGLTALRSSQLLVRTSERLMGAGGGRETEPVTYASQSNVVHSTYSLAYVQWNDCGMHTRYSYYHMHTRYSHYHMRHTTEDTTRSQDSITCSRA